MLKAGLALIISQREFPDVSFSRRENLPADQTPNFSRVFTLAVLLYS